MKKYIKYIAIVLFIILVSTGIYCVVTEKSRTSEQFAANLFNYPVPAHTKVVQKNCFYGYSFGHLLGSGGYMPVIASVELKSSLSKEEIFNYYKNIRMFPYPNSRNRGVEVELFFKDNAKRKDTVDGYYYIDKSGETHKYINDYFNKKINFTMQGDNNTHDSQTTYILQISSSFDYLLNIS